MKFWDSSALVPLLVNQQHTRAVRALYRNDPIQTVWWATEIECTSAIARLERAGGFANAEVANKAYERLRLLRESWHEVQSVAEVKETAARSRLHPMRAPHALQFAAAFILSERRPSTLNIVSFDTRINDAARREGFKCAF